MIDLCLTALHSKPKLNYLEVYLNPVYLAGFIKNLQALKVFSSFLLRYMIRMGKYSLWKFSKLKASQPISLCCTEIRPLKIYVRLSGPRTLSWGTSGFLHKYPCSAHGGMIVFHSPCVQLGYWSFIIDVNPASLVGYQSIWFLL